MSIDLKRYAGVEVFPIDDIRINSKLFKNDGITDGCVLTHLGTNQVRIANGAGMIMGGDFVIVQEDLSVALASTGTLPGRIYIHVDLSNTTTPVQFLSVAQETLPALVQEEDLWTEAGIWDMELATYTAGVSAITDLVVTYENIYNLTGKTLTGVLATGDTEITLTDSIIVTDGTVKYDIYVESSDMMLSYRDWTIVTGSMTFTFYAQAEDIVVRVEVRGL